MAQTQLKNTSKKTAAEISRTRKKKIKKAQEVGALSDVPISHTSKAKILKAVRKEKPQKH
ncbi:hypothetical protein [Bdellovibrio sp. HCB2-146]|uniref:hypothetical protein n=1 Tax=Bdellovibrio sp. HCB2-146 TaxID=3394362 RepID=UPI0039BD2F62